MLNVRQILVSAGGRAALMVGLCVAGATLAACGQKGALYLPREPAARQRATLPETLRPTPAATPSATPASGSSR